MSSPRPVDVLGATHCQHQEPHQKQLAGAPHGPYFQEGRPSPQGGLEHRHSPVSPSVDPPQAHAPGGDCPLALTPAQLSLLPAGEAPQVGASSPIPQPASPSEASRSPATYSSPGDHRKATPSGPRNRSQHSHLGS